jgi:hypothetical protein
MEGRPHRLALKPFDNASGNDSYLRKRDSVSDMAGVDVNRTLRNVIAVFNFARP